MCEIDYVMKMSSSLSHCFSVSEIKASAAAEANKFFVKTVSRIFKPSH